MFYLSSIALPLYSARMRQIALSVLFLLLVAALLFDERAVRELDRGADWLDQRYAQVAFVREVHFEGLQRLETSDLVDLLPRQQSNFWWAAHRSELADAIRKHPLVQQVTVNACSRLSIDCYEFKLQERELAMLALDPGASVAAAPSDAGKNDEVRASVNPRLWAVARDGTFLAPLPLKMAQSQELRLYGKSFDTPVLVRGMFRDQSISPDVVRSRINFVRDALRVIGEETGLDPAQAELNQHGELETSFR